MQKLPWLAAPVAAAFAIRLALLTVALVRTGSSVLVSGDTVSYLIPGRDLLFHGRFATGALAEINRTPGYPLFLAIASLAGVAFAALAQIAISAISVILVARLAQAVFADEHITLIAAWFFAFEPVSTIYSVRLLPETLYLALLLLSLERMAVFLRNGRLPVLAVSGLWLAAATFVRPVSCYLAFALALGLLVAHIRIPGLRWKAPAVLLVAVLPWLAAWQARNWVEAGFGGFSTIVSRNLYFYQAAGVYARATRRPFAQVQRSFGYPDEESYLARHPEQAHWSRSRRAAFMASQAMSILRQYPGVALRMQAEGSTVVALTPCAADLLRMIGAWPHDWPSRIVNRGPLRSALWLARAHPLISAVMGALEAFLLLLYFLAARGIVRAGPRNLYVWFLLGVALYFLAVSGGAQAVGRYRLPVMPIVCILAAAGVAHKRAASRDSAVDATALELLEQTP